MLYKGFKFGMLLQLAVGPMCLLVFSTSSANGFVSALTLVIAIALIDALYITLSGFGASALIENKKVKYVIKIFGGIVLILFGFNTFLGMLHYSILPNIKLFHYSSKQNLFLQGIVLTASNPLTIIFWSGVFSSQIIENNLTKKQLFFFGLGCILSTLVFLTLIAALGSVVSRFLPETVICIMNGLVGIVLIYFGIRLFNKK